MNLESKPCLFSPCRQYRYTLWRSWDDMFQSSFLMVIGLNPSTADETRDDPTIRRCIDFAKRWGHGALLMTNLFAFRATKPEDMKRHPTPVGDANDEVLRYWHGKAAMTLAAWGAHGSFMNRDHDVTTMLGDNLHCLRFTKDGCPSHPLYVPAVTIPTAYA